MSTRSLIARKDGDAFEAVYCHHDGYPQHHAPILTGHYATEEALAALLDLGDLSALGPRPGQKHDFPAHAKTPETEEWCLAYGRDRGEPDTEKRRYASETELLDDARRRWAQYVYLFQDGRWFCRSLIGDESWRELTR